MKKLIYLLVFSVFLGTQILALDIGFKLSMYRILFLGIFCIFSVMFINNDQRLRFYPKKLSSTYMLFYTLWLLYSLLSIVWSQNLVGWTKANIFIGIGVFTIIFIHLFIKEEKDILNLFRSVGAGVAIHIFIGLAEIITGKYLWASNHFMTKYQPASRTIFTRIPISIYPNENDYATVLLMGSFWIIFLLRNAKTIYTKIGYFSLLFFCFILIYQTDSRANLLAFFIGAGAMLLAYFSSVITKKGIFITFITAGILGTTFVIASESIREKISELISLISGNAIYDGSSNMTRMNLIKNGFYFLRDTLGFGVGAGNIEHWMKTNAFFQVGDKSNMHNWWMEILTGYGVFIFVLYVLVYASMLLRAYQYYRYSKDAFVRNASLSIIGYLAAFTLSSISSASNIINEWQWVIFGIIIAFFSYCESLGVKKEQVSYITQKKNNEMIRDFVGGQHG